MISILKINETDSPEGGGERDKGCKKKKKEVYAKRLEDCIQVMTESS